MHREGVKIDCVDTKALTYRKEEWKITLPTPRLKFSPNAHITLRMGKSRGVKWNKFAQGCNTRRTTTTKSWGVCVQPSVTVCRFDIYTSEETTDDHLDCLSSCEHLWNKPSVLFNQSPHKFIRDPNPDKFLSMRRHSDYRKVKNKTVSFVYARWKVDILWYSLCPSVNFLFSHPQLLINSRYLTKVHTYASSPDGVLHFS